MVETIDLTLSDDEKALARPPKRARASPSRRHRPSASLNGSFSRFDDEVMIVDRDSEAKLPSQDVPFEGDQELAIVGMAGEVWNADLPHTRDLCGVSAFQCRPSPSNSQFCSKCYCYVCDCLASECPEWGSGTAVSHHCNAHARDLTYKQMRTQRIRSGRHQIPSSSLAAAGESAVAAVGAAAAPEPPRNGAAARGTVGPGQVRYPMPRWRPSKFVELSLAGNRPSAAPTSRVPAAGVEPSNATPLPQQQQPPSRDARAAPTADPPSQTAVAAPPGAGHASGGPSSRPTWAAGQRDVNGHVIWPGLAADLERASRNFSDYVTLTIRWRVRFLDHESALDRHLQTREWVMPQQLEILSYADEGSDSSEEDEGYGGCDYWRRRRMRMYDDEEEDDEDEDEWGSCGYWRRRRMRMFDDDDEDEDEYGYDSDSFGYGGHGRGLNLLEMEQILDLEMFGRGMAGGAVGVQSLRKLNPGPCNLVEMSSPEVDASLTELGTVELRCQAKKATIADLAKRLKPYGFYECRTCPVQYGDTISLQSLAITTDPSMTEEQQQPGGHLELLPHSILDTLPEPSPTRTWSAVVLHHDGRAPPQRYGAEVPKDACLGDVVAAVEKQMGLPPSEHLLAMRGPPRCVALHRVNKAEKISDKPGWAGVMLHRLPRSSPDLSYPSFAAIFHRTEHQDEGHPCCFQGGNPTVVELGLHLSNGGPPAQRAVLGRVLQALAPLLKEGRPPLQVAQLERAGVKLRRVTPTGEGGSDHAAHFFDRRKQFNSTMNLMCGTASFFKDGVVFLELVWPRELLDNYDLGRWKDPPFHSQAAKEAVAATERYLQDWAKWELKKQQAEQLPHRLLKELSAAAVMRDPAAPPSTWGNKPLVRVRLRLVPDTRSKTEVKGRLQITVWVWEHDGAGHRSFFEEQDFWPNVREWGELENEGAAVLPKFLEVLLEGREEYREMTRRMQEWERKAFAMEPGVPGLMEALEQGELPAAPQPPGLTVQMRPYQLQSLRFMLEQEEGEGGFRRHLYLRLADARGRPWFYSPLLIRACRAVPAMPWGGFCCEEMGLGKTVEMLGLILANPAPPPEPPGQLVHKDPQGLILSRATLVVCAVSLVGQWVAEATQKLDGSLRIYQYHGTGRIRDPARLATEYDIVVTTYATLNADYSKGTGKADGKAKVKQPLPVVNAPTSHRFPPLGAVKWHRLVLDESHTVKNAAVGHTRAAMALQADRRWLCSGTPMNTGVEDLQGQFSVLGLAPYNNTNFFNARVRAAFHPGAWSTCRCNILLYLLGQCMIRHTKRQQLGGEEVLKLPPMHQEDIAVHLTAEEQQLYLSAHARAKELFEQYLQLGNHQINKHLLQVMALLLPMRRVCSGGELKPKDLEVSDAPLLAIHGRAAGGANLEARDASLVAPEEECPVCMDNFERPVITACHHWYCRECILGVIHANPKCPLCRSMLAASELRAGVTAAEAAAAAAEAAGPGAGGEALELQRAQQAVSSESKLQALLKELRAMRRRDSSAKALVFSQYMTTIEWLKVRLTQEGFGYRYISGSMPLKQRAKAIEAFQGDPPTTVFLLSMRSGSVGINLTAANHVFLMEPALNPALEDQAIGRSWRMGQTREVTVKRFYVKGSVEERIMEVVKTRQGGLGQRASTEADLEEAPSRSNVHVQNLAGNIQADRQQLRVTELKVLFKDPVFPPPRVPEPEEGEGEGGRSEDSDAPGPSRRNPLAGHISGRPRRVAAARASHQMQRSRELQREREQQLREAEQAGDGEGRRVQSQQGGSRGMGGAHCDGEGGGARGEVRQSDVSGSRGVGQGRTESLAAPRNGPRSGLHLIHATRRPPRRRRGGGAAPASVGPCSGGSGAGAEAHRGQPPAAAEGRGAFPGMIPSAGLPPGSAHGGKLAGSCGEGSSREASEYCPSASDALACGAGQGPGPHGPTGPSRAVEIANTRLGHQRAR